MTFSRTTSENPGFIKLVKLLDAELAIKDGEEHAFYAQYNSIDEIKHVIIAYLDEQPVSCGAIKYFAAGIAEIKRMYTLGHFRNHGIGGAILSELETWAKELGYTKCILETGKRQPDAIRLYEKSHYKPIPNYGQYVGMENSVCFEKILI